MKQNGDATLVAYANKKAKDYANEVASPNNIQYETAISIADKDYSEILNANEFASPEAVKYGAATSVAEKSKSINATKVATPKRNLPHADLVGYYQFLTFRTHDSIDDYLTRISKENISTSLKQYKADEYLDRSSKGAYLNGEVLHYLSNFFKEKDGELYELVAFSIMPNHVHMLFRQIEEIGQTVKRLKGASSIAINKILNRSGTLWEKSYFDKAIRNEEHFETVYNYIENNAVKAGLDDAKERFYGIYE